MLAASGSDRFLEKTGMDAIKEGNRNHQDYTVFVTETTVSETGTTGTTVSETGTTVSETKI